MKIEIKFVPGQAVYRLAGRKIGTDEVLNVRVYIDAPYLPAVAFYGLASGQVIEERYLFETKQELIEELQK